MRLKYIYLLVLAALASCADDVLPGNGELPAETVDDIRIGGVMTSDALTSVAVESRATGNGDVTDAELVDWLVQPLFNGFTIVYNKTGDTANERMAMLRLEKEGDGSGTPPYKTVTDIVDGNPVTVAKYSFIAIDPATGLETAYRAKWFSNGEHTFKGVYAPKGIWEGSETLPANFTSDQSDDSETGNYNLLCQYSSMPANCKINATVERIKLPFYHRMSRVLAYILIDPEIGSGVTLEGYKRDADGNPVAEEDATTTSFRFENVGVLKSVKREYNDAKKRYTHTPQWTTVRKLIPHFFSELGTYDVYGNKLDDNFIMYKDLRTDKFITADCKTDWVSARDAYKTQYDKYFTDNSIDPETATDAQKKAAAEFAQNESKYARIDYGKVPVYDAIVRPTYATAADVMADEASGVTASATNSIDFTLKLSNGLEYGKKFEFDMNANQMTVVYLRISREQIDYNSSGSETWISDDAGDGRYGVNNENGNRLSLAGGSWQRAYRYDPSFTDPDITDGSHYGENGEDDHIAGEDGQYLTPATWISRLSEAYEGGAHHGDYFILDSDITIDGSLLPADFVFTGHLDARGHTITVTGREYLFSGLNARYRTAQEDDPSITEWEANVHRETNGGTYWVPLYGYRAEVLNTVVAGARLFVDGATLGKTDADDVNGYVFNCKDITGNVTNLQDIPQY